MGGIVKRLCEDYICEIGEVWRMFSRFFEKAGAPCRLVILWNLACDI